MNENDLAFIERVVRDALTSRDEKARIELMELAEKLGNDSSQVTSLIYVLEQSTEALTVHFASAQLQQLFTQSVNSFTVADRKHLRAMLIPILIGRVEWFCKVTPNAVPGLYALGAFSQLLARVWRICWFEIADNIEAVSSDSEDDTWFAGAPSKYANSAMGGSGMGGSNTTTNVFGNLNGNGSVMGEDGEDPLLHVVAKKLITENPTLASRLVGITVLVSSIEELAKPLPHLWPAVQRKTAVAFRDRCLLDIFKLGLQTLQKILMSPSPMTEPAKSQQKSLVSATLDLIQRVFSFDFVGTMPDESSDDLGIVHIPASWSSIFENPDTFLTFSRFYMESQGSEQNKVMEILSSFISVRSSVFGPMAAQASFLNSFFDFLGKVLSEKIGLNQHLNRHILCRLLVRLKCNFHLSQFVAVPTWKAVIELIANFHIELMNDLDCNPNLIYYIMQWWQRLCVSVAYLSANSEPTHLTEILPAIVTHLIKSQLKREEEVPDDEDALIDNKQLQTILACVPTILEISGRAEVIGLIIELFNHIGSIFACYNTYNPDQPLDQLGIVERQLALLVHVISLLSIERGSSLSITSSSAISNLLGISGGMSGKSEMDGYGELDPAAAAAEQMENLEVEMVSCVFNLLQLHDERFSMHGPGAGSQQLEHALACFLRQFSANYFSNDDVEKRKVHAVLRDRHGLETKEKVLEAILSKIALNLKNWSNGTEVAKETLQLFLALVNGSHSSRLVAKSELVASLLANHTELDLGESERNRREFYRVLGRIAFKDSEIDELYTFLEPFDQNLISLRDKLQIASKPEHLNELARPLMYALCDIRGALTACHSSSGYENFFDWFYPSGYYDSICLLAIQRYAGFNWSVVWSVLRFVEEMVTNTHKRIQFPSASPDGHRLFRDTANILLVVAERIMDIQLPQGGGSGYGSGGQDSVDQAVKNAMDTRFKAITLYLRIFSRLLGGASDFANIGVFALFGDKIVSDVFISACRMIFSMDMEDAQGYPKVIDVLYIALENICLHNITDLLGSDLTAASDALGELLLLLKRGLRSKVVRIVCCCTQALEKVALHQWNYMHKRRRPDALPSLLTDAHINVLGDIMFELLDLVLIDRDMIHWTLCRPLFVLIQLLPDTFARLQTAIIKSQAHIPERSEKLEEAFKLLSVGLDASMRAENREKFTHNALELKNTCKTLIDFNILYRDMMGGGQQSNM
jgi:exportin-7